MMVLKDEAAVDPSVPETKTRLVPPCKGQVACLAALVKLVTKMIVSSVLCLLILLGGELLLLLLKYSKSNMSVRRECGRDELTKATWIIPKKCHIGTVSCSKFSECDGAEQSSKRNRCESFSASTSVLDVPQNIDGDHGKCG